MSRIRINHQPGDAGWFDEGGQEHVSRASRAYASVPAAQVGDMFPIVSYGGMTPTNQGKTDHRPPKAVS